MLTIGALTPIHHSVPLVLYASQPGGSTLDQGEGGGNPFASALIELLKRPSLTYGDFRSRLVALTRKKSHGFQLPEAPISSALASWRLKPALASMQRFALVVGYSDYRKTGRANLPGVALDLKRVATALRNAGFQVQEAANPSRMSLEALLLALARRSEFSEAAVIYATGHGFERHGRVYLAANDQPFEEKPDVPSEGAISVPSLGAKLTARVANLVFFGGCRSF